MKNQISTISLLCCYFLMIIVGFFYYPKWQALGNEATISWDVSGYYMYLPAIFIYKDLKKCNFKDKILADYGPTPDPQQFFLHSSGNYVMKYSIGQAILMSPFFFLAHAIATHSSTYPPDGFSYPYQICLGIGMFLYALIGLYFLRKVLLYYFNDKTVALTLVAIVFGSNYLNYSSIDQAQTHSTLFTLYSILLYLSITFYQKPSALLAILIGCVTGGAMLIRPTEIISILLPLLWGISSLKDLKERGIFAQKNLKYLFYAGFFFCLIVSIQLCYWKYVSGDWLVYSYGDQSFNWLMPHFESYMFGYQAGWLLYCPMLFLPFFGIFPFFKQKQNLLPILLFFALDLYIVSAWDIWWYGGRAMIQSYPILAFCIAALITYIQGTNYWKYVFYTFFGLFIYLNFWWTHNSHKGHIQVTNSSSKYYWATLGRWKVDENTTKLLDNRDSYRGVLPETTLLYEKTLDKDNLIVLDKDHQNSPTYFIPLPSKNKIWIRAYADIECVEQEGNIWKMAQIILKFYKGEELLKTSIIRMPRFLQEGKRRIIYIDAKMPKTDVDKITVDFWNGESDKKIIIHALKVESF